MQSVSCWTFIGYLVWGAVILLCLPGALPLTTSSSRNSRDFYEVLGLYQTSTNRDVRKAFRQLAMKYHPDKNNSSDAEERFREITEAYKVLSNQEKRRLYDLWGHKAFLENNGESAEPEYGDEMGSFSFEELFDDLNREDLFLNEPVNHWSFDLGSEDDYDPYEGHSFPGINMFWDVEQEEEKEVKHHC